jgi:hypothetical protein
LKNIEALDAQLLSMFGHDNVVRFGSRSKRKISQCEVRKVCINCEATGDGVFRRIPDHEVECRGRGDDAPDDRKNAADRLHIERDRSTGGIRRDRGARAALERKDHSVASREIRAVPVQNSRPSARTETWDGDVYLRSDRKLRAASGKRAEHTRQDSTKLGGKSSRDRSSTRRWQRRVGVEAQRGRRPTSSAASASAICTTAASGAGNRHRQQKSAQDRFAHGDLRGFRQ